MVCGSGIASGLAIAAVLAPKDGTFAMNFAHFWLPHAILIALLFVLRVPIAEIGGFAIALALYLLGYYIWVVSKGAGGMAWLGYASSTPGAALAAVILRLLYLRHRATNVALSAGAGFLAAAIGITAGQTVVCSTVMYCGS